MNDRNHPAVEAARRALAADDENGCMIEQHEGNGMWTCLAHGVSADGPEMCWYVRDMPPIVLNAAREHYTADDLRDTPAGRELMAEGWEEGMLDHMGRRRGIMSSEMVSIIRERIADTNPYRGGDGAAS